MSNYEVDSRNRGDSVHEIIDGVQLEGNAELHRFIENGVPFTAIYVNGQVVWSCVRGLEAAMVRAWNGGLWKTWKQYGTSGEGDAGMFVKDKDNEKEIFEYVVRCMYEKLALLEDKDAQELIENVLTHIKNTGATYYISYKPEIVKLMEEHWQFFCLICDSSECIYRRNLCSTARFSEDGDYGIWVFDPELVTYLSGVPLDVIEASIKADERLLLGLEPSVPGIVYLLRMYDKHCQLLPSVMVFRNEASARETATEMVPGGCRYEVVSAEVSD